MGLLEKALKTVVCVAILPVTATIDAVTIPWISTGDRESSVVKNLKAISGNVEDIATGKWEEK